MAIRVIERITGSLDLCHCERNVIQFAKDEGEKARIAGLVISEWWSHLPRVGHAA